MNENEHGTYVLVLVVAEEQNICIGERGDITFPAGTYYYVGSALGPGGFKRIERHRCIASGDKDTRHWHIDYLLSHATVKTVTTYPAAVECEISRHMNMNPVPGFGATDCSCGTHLYYQPSTHKNTESPHSL